MAIRSLLMNATARSIAGATRQWQGACDAAALPMTVTYEPRHPSYLDEADVRGELTRTFDICRDCRQCVAHCGSFPTLFDMLDTRASELDQVGAGWLTPAQQDSVIDACFQCKLCVVDCPSGPGTGDDAIDVARLMLRSRAMQRDQRLVPSRPRAVAGLLCRTSLTGRIVSRIPFVNGLVTAQPGSWRRRLLRGLSGLSATRSLMPFAAQTFSSWFAERPKVRLNDRQGRVALVPTCLVDYQATDVGKDLVRVYERNGIECADSVAVCCGAPWLHAGSIDRFAKLADRAVKRLADEVRAGNDIVVMQPTCGAVIREDFVNHVTTTNRREDAELVAAHTYDGAEYLMRLHAADHTVLDLDFAGVVPRSVAYHASSQLRVHDDGYASRDLLWLTGARIDLIRKSAGASSVWHLRADHDAIAVPRSERLGELVEQARADIVAGDCALANSEIAQRSSRPVVHPVQVLARAYGIAED